MERKRLVSLIHYCSTLFKRKARTCTMPTFFSIHLSLSIHKNHPPILNSRDVRFEADGMQALLINKSAKIIPYRVQY